MWNTIKSIWTKAWTSFLGWTKVWVAGLLGLVHYVGQGITDPGIKEALSHFTFPNYVWLGLAVLGFLTIASAAHEAE